MAPGLVTILLVVFGLLGFCVPDSLTQDSIAHYEPTIDTYNNPNTHLAFRSNATGNSIDRIMRRWYSVFRYQDRVKLPGDGAVPWPSPCMSGSSENAEWLPGERWLRYCFEDQSSQVELEHLLMHAIAKWAPAFHYSSLRGNSFYSKPLLVVYADVDEQ